MKIMGHRGARNEAPENTLEGFELARELKLPSVELDIHLSLDGKLMVIHDETVDRTCSGKGKVSEMTSNELRLLDAGEGTTIPYLKEVCDLLLPAHIEIQIEIKDGKTLSPLNAYLKELSQDQRQLLTVISFNHLWLKEFKGSNPTLKTATLLYGRPLNAPEIARAADANGVSFNIAFIDEELREQTRREGLSLTGWNANNEEDFKKMEALELDYLGTDTPTQAKEWASRP
jgi:glycerophosphoryl diester phosphodiesterase